MAIKSRANQYWGVNAHFNSYAQNTADGWKSFHTRYIVALGDVIDAALPSGYELDWETSLQIKEVDPNTGEPINRPKRPEPDITIWETANRPETASASHPLITPTLTKSAVELLSQDEEYYTALVIYDVVDGERVPVSRIELLSPSNKPGGSNYEKYLAKQDLAIRAGGASLVIIDFLHQSNSPIRAIPSYPNHEENAFPYTITIIDPRPTVKDGKADIYGFHVDDPIPMLAIPLSGQETVLSDFGRAYNHAYTAVSSFSNHVESFA